MVILSSCCGIMRSAVSLEVWDAGSIPSLTQWVKDTVLQKLWLRSPLQLGSYSWPENSICCGVTKKENLVILTYIAYIHVNTHTHTHTHTQTNMSSKNRNTFSNSHRNYFKIDLIVNNKIK